MKLDIKIRWNVNIDGHGEGEVQVIAVDCDYIEDKGDLLQAIEDEIGEYDEDVHFEIINEEQFWNDMDCPASEITNPQVLVKEDPRIEKIRNVLRRYFEFDDNGDKTEEFDEDYCSQAAIDDIHSIIGNF